MEKNFNKLDKVEDAIDFDWALGLNRFSLRLMRIWPTDDDVNNSFQSSLRVPIMIFILFFGLFLPQMYALSLVINELPLVIDNLLTSCAAFTSCVKLFFIWRSKEVLRPVVQLVHHDWTHHKSVFEFDIMVKQASRARLITIMDYSIMAMCYAGFVVAPILGFNLRTITNSTDYGQRHLLVQSYYPFDYSVSPRFELAYIFQLMGSFFVGMAVSIPDDYFGALVYHASGQYEVLGAKIQNLISVHLKGVRELSYREIDENLRFFVKKHVQLNTMVAALEKSFGFIIAAQIFCMSIMICCLGFQILSMVDNTGDKPTPLQIVTLVGTLFTMMIHTLVDCFASETLATQSAGVFFKIYNCQWYTLNSRRMRCFIPMMVISKYPRQIRAGKILKLSLATYCSIIKSTAGYISMLIAVSKR